MTKITMHSPTSVASCFVKRIRALALAGTTVLSMHLAAATLSAEPAHPQERLNLAILIFDGVQIIDYTGPYETFGQAYSKDGPLFNIYTVGQTTRPITTAMGMSVNPKYRFENAPRPDVLLIPGGGGVAEQLNNADVIKWVRDEVKNASVTMSVCNGAFILAKAGVLDGLEATTTFELIAKLREAAPKTKVVDNKRYVDNGKIITAAGLSSGIDCSLHVIEKLFGKGTAQMAALGMEYNWDPDSRFVRAALADKYMLFAFDVKFLPGGWKPLTREGDPDHWENRWLVRTESSATDLLQCVNKTIEANKKVFEPSLVKWNQVKSESNQEAGQSLWKFTDENGDEWTGVVRVESSAEQANQFTLTVKVARNTVTTKQPGELPKRSPQARNSAPTFSVK